MAFSAGGALANAVGARNLRGTAELAERLSRLVRHTSFALSCLLLLAGVFGFLLGVVVGCVFLSGGSKVVGIVGIAGGAAVLAYCLYNMYTLRRFANMAQVVLRLMADKAGSREELIAELKHKLPAAFGDKVGAAAAAFVCDELRSSFKTELQKVLFGPPALAVLLGASVLAPILAGEVGLGQATTVGIAIAVLSIVFGCLGLCIALGVYCVITAQVEEVLKELEKDLAERFSEEVGLRSAAVIGAAVDAAAGPDQPPA